VYHTVAGALSAVAKGACAHSGFDSKDVHAKNCLHLAGKKMGYAALGRVREEWVPYLDDMYHLRKVRGVRGLLGDNRTEEDERDLARTSQEVFQRISLRLIGSLLARYPRVEGIVMTGGCGLNVLLNMEVQRRFGYPVHVAPAPNDGGLAA
jgi:carbamoyltransferase